MKLTLRKHPANELYTVIWQDLILGVSPKELGPELTSGALALEMPEARDVLYQWFNKQYVTNITIKPDTYSATLLLSGSTVAARLNWASIVLEVFVNGDLWVQQSFYTKRTLSDRFCVDSFCFACIPGWLTDAILDSLSMATRLNYPPRNPHGHLYRGVRYDTTVFPSNFRDHNCFSLEGIYDPKSKDEPVVGLIHP